MSLQSEIYATVIAAKNVVSQQLYTAALPGQAQVSVAQLIVPPTGLPANDAVYTLPLSFPIPKGSFVYQTVVDVLEGVESSSGNNQLGLDMNGGFDLSSGGIPLVNLTTGNALGYYTTLIANNNYTSIQVTVTDVDPLTKGKLSIKVLFV